MMTPIPYAHEPLPQPYGEVRVLMERGTWRVSERERPEDWRERCEPKPLPPPKPVRDWAAERHAASQLTRAPHKPGAGRPAKPAGPPAARGKVGRPRGTGRITITAAELLHRTKTQTMREIAGELGCDVSFLYRLLAAAGGAPAKLPCRDCGGVITSRAHNAKRCTTCAYRHTLDLHNEARKQPAVAARLKVYRREWKRKRREDLQLANDLVCQRGHLGTDDTVKSLADEARRRKRGDARRRECAK